MCVQARAHKAEASTKLEQLQRDIAELSSLSPDLVDKENEATRALHEVGDPLPFLRLLMSSCPMLQVFMLYTVTTVVEDCWVPACIRDVWHTCAQCIFSLHVF